MYIHNMYSWIESNIYDEKLDDFINSSILIMELYDKFLLYNCKDCDEDNLNNNCFYCFSNYLKNKIFDENKIKNFIIEIDNLKDYEYEPHKYMILGYEMKEIYYLAHNNHLMIFCKKLSDKEKNIVVKDIFEKMDIFLKDNFIYETNI
jgi:hypothetical protein